MPPFTIGKVFSDDAVNALQRERQMQADNAARAYQLELQRREQMDKGKLANRELDLRARALDAEAGPEERQLKLELLRDTVQGNREDRALKRDLSGAELEMSRSRLAGDVEDRALRKSLGETEKEVKLKSLDLDKTRIDEAVKSGEFERTVKIPGELAIKRDEVGRKAAWDKTRGEDIASKIASRRANVEKGLKELEIADAKLQELQAEGESLRTGRAANYSARMAEHEQRVKEWSERRDLLATQIELEARRVAEDEASGEYDRNVRYPGQFELDLRESNLKRMLGAKTVEKVDAEIARMEKAGVLDEAQARKLLQDNKWGDFDSMTRRLNALVNNYSAQTDINNAGATKEGMLSAQKELSDFLYILKTASKDKYDQVVKTMGATNLAPAAGSPEFGHTGYGAAGLSLDGLIKRLEKPPAVPKGK